MKQKIKFLALFAVLFTLDSCAFLFNDKETQLSISSNPPGANVIIDGKNYGRTPANIKILPKNYTATLIKEGHGSAKLDLQVWQAIRSKKGEGGRCLADALGAMLVAPAFSFMSVYCRDFKQAEYFVDIPYQGPIGANRYDNNNEISATNPAYQQYYQPNYGQPKGTPQQTDSYQGF